jgi:hypothetical protein
MNWIDRLMDTLTRRTAKPVGSGHSPEDPEPETGSDELSTELQSAYGRETPSAEPPDDGPPEAP